MKIRHKVYGGIGAALLLVGSASILLLYAFQHVSRIVEVQQETARISRSMADLELVAHEFWINRSQRASLQWRKQYDRTVLLFENMAPASPREQETLTKVGETLHRSGQLFGRLQSEIETMQQSKASLEALDSLVAEQLASQLLANSLSIMDELDFLVKAGTQRLLNEFFYLGIMLAVVFVLIVAVIFVLALVVFNNVLKPLVLLQEGTEKISRQELDFRIALTENNEMGAIGRSFNTMAESLLATAREKEQNSWVRDSLLQVDDALRGVDEAERAASSIVRSIASLLDIPVGVMYLQRQPGEYHYAAGFACDRDQCGHPVFRSGEGIPGQAVVKNRIFEIDDLPENYLQVVTGQLRISIGRLLLVPFSFKDDVVAVLEIGMKAPLSSLQRQFLQEASQRLAITLRGIILRNSSGIERRRQ